MGSCFSTCPPNVKKYCETGTLKRKFLGFTDTVEVWDTIVPNGLREFPCPICQTKMIMTSRRGNMEGVWEIAHVKAHSRGGTEELDNLRPVCKKCNRDMKAIHMKEYCIKKVPPDRLPDTLRILKLK